MIRILFPTDGSRASNFARLMLARVVDVHKAEITVLSNDNFFLGGRDPAESMARELRSAGFAAHPVTTSDHPVLGIINQVSRVGYETVVVGYGSGSPFGEALVGPSSRHFWEHKPPSLMVVRQPPSGWRILIGIDGSEQSRAAVEVVTRLADARRCPIQLLSVLDVPGLTASGVASERFPAVVQERSLVRWLGVEPGVVAAERAALGDARKITEAAGFRTRSYIVLGNPAEQLRLQAETNYCALVAVGSRHLGPYSRITLRSVSREVCRLAPASLIVRGVRPSLDLSYQREEQSLEKGASLALAARSGGHPMAIEN